MGIEEMMKNVVGMEDIKAYLGDIVRIGILSQQEGMKNLIEDWNLHLAFLGNPGTGKTMMARLVGDVYKEAGILTKGHVIAATREDLLSEYVGQTALKTRRVIEKAMGGVLFIDEAYSLTKGEKDHAGFGFEAIHELAEAMTDHKKEFVVIATGYPQEMDVFFEKNPEFARKFKVFTIEDYTPEELHQIFTMTCKANEYNISSELEEMMDGFFQKYKEMESETRVWENAREAIRLAQGMLRTRQKEAVKEGYRDGYRELFRNMK